MARYHLSPRFKGEPRVCSARFKCDYADANDGEGIEHYPNKAAAMAAHEANLAEELDTMPTAVSKPEEHDTVNETPETADDTAEQSNNDEVTFSFLKKFEAKEQEFEEDFEGFPNKFFNADLAGRTVMRFRNRDGEGYYEVPTHPNKLTQRLTNAVSSPKDVEKVSDAELEQYASNLGFENFQEITSVKILGILKSSKAYVADDADGNKVIITREGSNSKFLGRYRFNGLDHDEALDGERRFTHLDARGVIAASRIQHKTARNVLTAQMGKKTAEDRRADALSAYHELSDAQLEGKNFLNQKKYVRENSGKVATAWMDKKNPSQEAVDMMENTKLKGPFRHVEVDSDVDPQEFADFEKAYHEVADKLPKIPGGMEPELRIRKLGKHGSAGFQVNGLFNPAKNAIAIDVRNSGSFVHEYGHQIDMVVQDNASLRDDFRGITKEYSQSIKLPENATSRREYYTTATEIHSRAFEIYASERLGINNRLLDTTKFNDFDYAPITNNPELKQKAFDFFDKIFEKK